jgi:prepilin-type N-terminal cleavage/methylation domain-containing protein
MPRGRRGQSGFTLVELLIAMVIGVVVMMAATDYALMISRSLAGSRLRDGITRNARFLGLALQRDLQEAGVGLASSVNFGSVGVWNDTLIILRVPYAPSAPAVYSLQPPPGTNNPLLSGGTCGGSCLDLKDPLPLPPLAMQKGQIARLMVNSEPRLLYVNGVTPGVPTAQITFAALPSLLHHNYGLNNGLRLDRFGTTVQQVAFVAYWRDANNNLLRAEQTDSAGGLQGEVIATGVQRFDVSLIFTDGTEADLADGTDANPNNDFNDISYVHVQTVVRADATDPRVAKGALLTRSFDWSFSPRNLVYERNRIP